MNKALGTEGKTHVEVREKTEVNAALNRDELKLEEILTASEYRDFLAVYHAESNDLKNGWFIEVPVGDAEQEDKLEDIRHEYKEERREKAFEGVTDRFEILEKGVKAVDVVLETYDLKKKEKVVAAFMNAIPLMGFVHAYWGEKFDEIGWAGGLQVNRTYKKLNALERTLSLAGELLPVPGGGALISAITSNKFAREQAAVLSEQIGVAYKEWLKQPLMKRLPSLRV